MELANDMVPFEQMTRLRWRMRPTSGMNRDTLPLSSGTIWGEHELKTNGPCPTKNSMNLRVGNYVRTESA